MREISPAKNATADEYLNEQNTQYKALVEKIRKEKNNNKRNYPSATLIDKSTVLTDVQRRNLIDKVAKLVDENLIGRSDMCHQFSLLLAKALVEIGLDAKPVKGISTYYINKIKVFHWDHYWVRIGNEVIDANVDSIGENINIRINNIQGIRPYWGPASDVPDDRMLRQDHSSNQVANDQDVDNTWWPDLYTWLSSQPPYN